MKNFKDKIDQDIFRTTGPKKTWIDITIELLPYLVGMAGIITLMVMLNTLSKIFENL